MLLGGNHASQGDTECTQLVAACGTHGMRVVACGTHGLWDFSRSQERWSQWERYSVVLNHSAPSPLAGREAPWQPCPTAWSRGRAAPPRGRSHDPPPHDPPQ